MLVSFIANMPRQCLRQSLLVATQSIVAFSSALYFGGCISSISPPPIAWAKACEVEASAAAVPAAAMNSRRSIVFLLSGFGWCQRPNHPLCERGMPPRRNPFSHSRDCETECARGRTLIGRYDMPIHAISTGREHAPKVDD